MKVLEIRNEVFTYDQLSEEAKMEVLQLHQNHYCEWQLEEDMKNDAENHFLYHEFPNAVFDDVYYDLSYSQGSGAMIELHYDNLDKFLEDNKDLKKKLNLSQSQIDQSYFELKVKHTGHYNHENSYNYEYYVEFADGVDESVKELIEERIEETFAHSNSKYYEMNKEFAIAGYSLIEDKEFFEQMEEDNPSYYYKNGNYACDLNDSRVKDEQELDL